MNKLSSWSGGCLYHSMISTTYILFYRAILPNHVHAFRRALRWAKYTTITSKRHTRTNLQDSGLKKQSEKAQQTYRRHSLLFSVPRQKLLQHLCSDLDKHGSILAVQSPVVPWKRLGYNYIHHCAAHMHWWWLVSALGSQFAGKEPCNNFQAKENYCMMFFSVCDKKSHTKVTPIAALFASISWNTSVLAEECQGTWVWISQLTAENPLLCRTLL